MRFLLAFALLVHGIAHGVGFAVPWRLVASPTAAYTTSLLDGRIAAGELGIKIVGLLWLAVGLGFVIAASGVAVRAAWSPSVVATLAAASLALSVLGLPDSRLGIPINLALLLGLVVHLKTGWSLLSD